MRGVDVQGADIDAPWLFDGESFLRVNGVDVIPLVEAELNRRFPGRGDRRAGDPKCSRSGRVASGWCELLATVASDELAATQEPVGPEYQETTLSCLHVILEEEWEHHRYAVRDPDAIEAKPDA